ncbi:MAG: CBS domain-containing protein [Fibrobacter sp.]|nr:CBS domain-containing protein [Fibrobacter sp.]
MKKISEFFTPPQETECVLANKELRSALETMDDNNFSQLLVIKNNLKNGKHPIKSNVQGCISYDSICKKLMVEDICLDAHVKDFLEQDDKILWVESNKYISDVAKQLKEHEYVIVVGEDSTILGFVTAYDISKLYLDMVTPYSLIEKIESCLRQLMSTVTLPEIKDAVIEKFLQRSDKSATPAIKEETDSRIIERLEDVNDMEFWMYSAVFEKMWSRFNLRKDKKDFLAKLEAIRKIRNEIMHFRIDNNTKDNERMLSSMGDYLDKVCTIINKPKIK